MSNSTRQFGPAPHPTPERPLQGMTVLLVEDSRLASEAVRLLCLRSGARLRRADCLAAARRHLAVYRPSVAIVDMGLPDGSGAELLQELAVTQPEGLVLIGTSGDPGTRAAALAAGAVGFLAKPVESLAEFQQTLLAHLPASTAMRGPRALPGDTVAPDRLALADDLMHAAEIMAMPNRYGLEYAAQFLGAVARSAHDTALEAAADSLARSRLAGGGTRSDIARVAGLVQDRLAAARAV